MSKKRKNNYLERQEREYQRLYAYFFNIAVSVIEWYHPNGLPEGMRSQYIERKLFELGDLVFMKGDIQSIGASGFFVLPVARTSPLNIYFEPTFYNLITPNRTLQRDITNSVLIRNNELRIPTKIEIQTLIEDLVDIKFAMKTNRNAACKTPPIIRGNKASYLSFINEYEQICGNRPVIFRDDIGANYGVEQFGFDNDRPPYYGAELREEYENIKAEIFNIIGITSNPIRKAERVNIVEATSNRGELVGCLQNKLSSRQEAVEKIIKMFPEMEGLEVRVNDEFVNELIEGEYTPDESAFGEEEGVEGE